MKRCLICKKKFARKKREGISDFNKRKFCSLECAYIGRKTNKGRKFSEEVRLKISKAKMGKPNYKARGKKYSKETKKKMRLGKLGSHPKLSPKVIEQRRKQFTGENNPNWIGGDLRYIKSIILKRDDYTCQICRLQELGIMEVDHIKPQKDYPKLKLEISNLQTLCPNCHRRKHYREKIDRILKITKT